MERDEKINGIDIVLDVSSGHCVLFSAGKSMTTPSRRHLIVWESKRELMERQNFCQKLYGIKQKAFRVTLEAMLYVNILYMDGRILVSHQPSCSGGDMPCS